jgi:LacI family transcriptional regulator, fructose operon transcriptional repressor
MTELKPRPTIKDIARLSETSPSTVSAVLTGNWKARRISDALASRIQTVAGEQGYSANRQARGLRRGRSDMIGLIVPMHDHRFFAAAAQSFEAEARGRGWCPIVVSTLRDPAEELRTAERLISHGVDSLVIAGASNPAALGALCRGADVSHVYLDLPGPDAPSVASDNHAGAMLLTDTLLDHAVAGHKGARSRAHFLGGNLDDWASARRIEGFCHAMARRDLPVAPDQVNTCGYAPSRARESVAALCERLGGLPSALFINSVTVFEGAMTYFATLASTEFAGTVIGIYDYDPIASFLPFPVYMVRQNAEALMARAFALIDEGVSGPVLIEIVPDLVPPRTIYAKPFLDLG